MAIGIFIIRKYIHINECALGWSDIALFGEFRQAYFKKISSEKSSSLAARAHMRIQVYIFFILGTLKIGNLQKSFFFLKENSQKRKSEIIICF